MVLGVPGPPFQGPWGPSQTPFWGVKNMVFSSKTAKIMHFLPPVFHTNRLFFFIRGRNPMQTPYYISKEGDWGALGPPWYRHTGDLAGLPGALARPRLGPLYSWSTCDPFAVQINQQQPYIARAKVMWYIWVLTAQNGIKNDRFLNVFNRLFDPFAATTLTIIQT